MESVVDVLMALKSARPKRIQGRLPASGQGGGSAPETTALARLRTLTLSLVVLLPPALTCCGDDTPSASLDGANHALSSAIVAGSPSRTTDFPATGVILYHSDDPNSPMGSLLCSGTLVAPDVVLAAGHCQELFEQENGPHVQYYFSLARDVSRYGPLVARVPDDAVAVRHFLPHPDYDFRKHTRGLGRAADLGLFFLAKPITSVRPATLIFEQALGDLVVGAKVTIVGYGRRMMTTFSGRDDGIKHQGKSTIRSVGPFEMRIGHDADDALKCHGDSGGPTFMEVRGQTGTFPVLVGITSRANDWAGCRTGGIDTRVDAYLDWIAESLAWACEANLRAAGCKASLADLTAVAP